MEQRSCSTWAHPLSSPLFERIANIGWRYWNNTMPCTRWMWIGSKQKCLQRAVVLAEQQPNGLKSWACWIAMNSWLEKISQLWRPPRLALLDAKGRTSRCISFQLEQISDFHLSSLSQTIAFPKIWTKLSNKKSAQIWDVVGMTFLSAFYPHLPTKFFHESQATCATCHIGRHMIKANRSRYRGINCSLVTPTSSRTT